MPNSLYSAIICYRDVEDDEGKKVREFLVIEYVSKKFAREVQIKFPGGTNVDHPGDTALETVHRETRDELHIVMPVDPVLIYTKEVQDRAGSGSIHTKMAHIINYDECAGTLRTEWMKERRGDVEDKDEDELSPPFWKTTEELMVEVDQGGLFWSHRPMLEAALKYLKHLDESNLLSSRAE